MINNLVTSLRQYLRQRLFTPQGFSVINDIAPTDIVVAGYPKSGNTWFQYLLAGLAFEVNPTEAPDLLIQDLIPDVHYKTIYKRYRDVMFFKSHHLPRPEYRRVIYLMRDGRDVMVSYWHHQQATSQKRAPTFLEMIEDGAGLFPSHWEEHITAWKTNPYNAEMLAVRYEDLLHEPIEVLRLVCDFADLKKDDADIRRMVEATTFIRMQKKEKNSRWDNPNWPTDRPFIRKGEVGSFKEEFPPEALTLFLERAGKTLERYWGDTL